MAQWAVTLTISAYAAQTNLCLDKFSFTLFDPAKGGFEGTYEGPLDHYLGCGHYT